MTDIAIQIKNVSKKFESEEFPALNNISANIRHGTVTGLVGPDGAGKTTLIRLITGLMRPTDGNITVCGFDTQSESQQIQNILGYMPQKFGLYEDLSVLENLELYARLHGLSQKEKEDSFSQMLDFTDLKRFTKRLAGRLSGGMKQKLGLACSLLSRPKVLLLDEPSVGVDPISRRELWKMVQALIKEGMTVIWSTSYLDEAQLCKEVILINEGTILFDGAPDTLTSRVEGRVFITPVSAQEKRSKLSYVLKQNEVVDALIQGDNIRVLLKENANSLSEITLTPVSPRFEDAFMDILKGAYSRQSVLAEKMAPKAKEDSIPIQAEDLSKHFGDFIAAQHISFTIKRGEIFGLLGPNGAGKSTTFKMLCGLLQPSTGKALVSGFDLKTASSIARSRIGYMAQKFSLYSDLSVIQNLKFFSGVYGLSGNDAKNKIQQMIDIFDLKHYLNTNAGTLPLGFKQRLALACAVMHEPDVLFLDEPTSGVDPLTRREFWVHINAMVQKGVTIMVTTHFMEEAEYCDRIAIIFQGKNIASDTPEALKNDIRSNTLPDPTLEDVFIELIKRKTTQIKQESIS